MPIADLSAPDYPEEKVKLHYRALCMGEHPAERDESRSHARSILESAEQATAG